MHNYRAERGREMKISDPLLFVVQECREHCQTCSVSAAGLVFMCPAQGCAMDRTLARVFLRDKTRALVCIHKNAVWIQRRCFLEGAWSVGHLGFT